MGKLTSHPPTVKKVRQLMAAYGNGRDDFSMHHINASRLDPGAGAAHWRELLTAAAHAPMAPPSDSRVCRLADQDYHCAADVFDRAQLMVHVFYYFNGLDGNISHGRTANSHVGRFINGEGEMPKAH